MLSCSSHRLSIIGYIALWAFSSLLYGRTPLWAQDADAEAAQHFAAAHQAQDAGNLDLAAQEYLAVIRLRPEVAEAYASLGLVYNAQGKFAESARALAKPRS
jgi:cytochrome c-type biogenesis protein CcmH/NrfG